MVSTNHWRDDTISRGRSPFSKNLTGWVMGRGSPIRSPGLGQQLDDAGLGLLDRLARQLAVGGVGRGRVVGLPALGAERHRQQAAVAADHGPGGQGELAPPHHVGGVAEGADHGDARALLGVGQLVGDHRHPHAEQRRGDLGAEQRPVALVVGVGHQGHAGGQQLGPGGLDLHAAVGVDPGEAQAVVGAGPLPVLELGLADRGAEVDVPQGGGGALDDLAPAGEAQEAPLGHPLGPLADGGVGVRPVDRQARACATGARRPARPRG